MVLIHRLFQLFQTAFLFLQELYMLQKLQSLYHQPFCKTRSKYQSQHQGNAKNIKSQSQIKDPHVISKISSEKTTAKYSCYHTDQYKHSLICNGNDHQYQRGHRDRHLVLFHEIDLHWLSSGRRWSNAAEKKAYKGIQGAVSHLYLCSQSTHHIENDR